MNFHVCHPLVREAQHWGLGANRCRCLGAASSGAAPANMQQSSALRLHRQVSIRQGPHARSAMTRASGHQNCKCNGKCHPRSMNLLSVPCDAYALPWEADHAEVDGVGQLTEPRCIGLRNLHHVINILLEHSEAGRRDELRVLVAGHAMTVQGLKQDASGASALQWVRNGKKAQDAKRPSKRKNM